MATKYLVGVSGGVVVDWFDNTYWSGSSGGPGGFAAPSLSDDVIIDNNSGTGGSLGGFGCQCLSITINNPVIEIDCNVDVYGNLTVSNTSIPFLGSFALYGTNKQIILNGSELGGGNLLSIFGTYTLTVFNGTVFTNFSIEGGTLTLAADLSLPNGNITINAGTLTATSPARTVTSSAGFFMNGGVLNCTNISTINVSYDWNIATAASLTGMSGCTINIYSTSFTFNGGGKTYGTLNYTIENDSTTINGSNTFSNLTLPSRDNSTYYYFSCTLGANQTITGTLSCTGTAIFKRMLICSSVKGTIRDLYVGSVNIQYADFKDINATGTWTGYSSTGMGDAGNNAGLTFPAGINLYWSSTGTSWNSNGWATSAGGTPASTNYPLPQDTAVFGNTYPGSNALFNFDVPNLSSINLTSRTVLLRWYSTNAKTYANIYFPSGTNVSFYNSSVNLTFLGRNGTFTFTPGGTSVIANIYIDAAPNIFSLGSNCSGTGTITVTSGIYQNASFSLSIGSFTVNGSSSANFTNTTTTISGSTFSVATTASVTTTGSTIIMTSASAKTFASGGKTYNILTQGGAGALSITGAGVFTTINNSVQPTTITFPASTTVTVTNFNVSGIAGSLVTINSSTAGTSATLSKSGGGVISRDYLSIKDSAATGAGATWYAGANSTNVSNNTGWIFSAPVAGSTGNFLMFLKA